jgi:hypothetical protein
LSGRGVAAPAERAGCGDVGFRLAARPGARGEEKTDMRSLLMLGLGVPIPIILLVAFCTHHL